ncbi:hypothetical protein M514_07900 [Trichuris suis]|uniref:Uncharacterized protein n=1 Tax=Trichuris suis TaxID=68888 RepID=A0A085N370_9BILA|nr:hypothetical protein M513_07900 [Trichuris suis]KFD63916.1 hypothetical protein M514_07900 [Trichuris suis]
MLTASDNPSPIAEFEGVDFEGFLAMDDEVATCSEPAPEAVFQAIMAEVRVSVKVHEATDEVKEASEDDTEMAETPKEDALCRVKVICFRKVPSGVVSPDSAFSTYICNKNNRQAKIDSFWERMTKL